MLNAQSFSGKVVDFNTGEPLESVSIYFDNTTIGTTTDQNGEFTITYNDAIVSGLVLSYLGYETVMISDYRSKSFQEFRLRPSINELDTVVINEDVGLTRRQKLRLFRQEFLGASENGRRCKILNEDDIYLRFSSKDQTLIASSIKPIIVLNKALNYELDYNIVDFEIAFSHTEPKNNVFRINSVSYAGTIFYNDLGKGDRTRNSIQKKREKTYNGSVQHFMRSLYFDKLESEGYELYFKGFKVSPEKYLKATTTQENDLKRFHINGKLSIRFNKRVQSFIQPIRNYFYVDQYGNHSPTNAVLFGGDMGRQRVGDILPLDYGLDK